MPDRISVGGDHSKKVILRGFFGNLKFKSSKWRKFTNPNGDYQLIELDLQQEFPSEMGQFS